ncbi:MAG: hypothetical protein KJ927_18910 [Candidatus Eisenbacteria bacterium]|nr:hypothetical protein [Candidatus Eisenbacteria bacterium]
MRSRTSKSWPGLFTMALAVCLWGCGEGLTNSTGQNPSSILEQARLGVPVVGQPSAASPETGTAPKTEGSLIYFYQRAYFDEAFPGLQVEDFEEGNIGDGQILGCSQPLNEHTDNDCFEPGDILPGIEILTNNDHGGLELALVGPDFFYNPSKNIAVTSCPDALILEFPDGRVNGLGLDLISYFTEEYFEIEIIGEDGFQAFTQAFAGNSGRFWGFASEVLISQVIITSPTDQSEAVDNIAFNSIDGTSEFLTVEIDIKPGNDLNTIRLGAKGNIPVALLSMNGFDATVVDPNTVTLGNDDGNDTPVAAKRNISILERTEDIDGDGDEDLVLHFSQAQLEENGDLHSETVELFLRGMLEGGLVFRGSDIVRVKTGRH